ncbi:MAG: histidine phosphatase family protein [Rubrivivax sp.]|nr:histidine phosphatase family protein [Rubrivivax sp.]
MKMLLLVRHAESTRDDPSLKDRDRPLIDRGRHDAPMMGKRLSARGAKPERLLSNPALRALTTAKLVADEVGYKRQYSAVNATAAPLAGQRVVRGREAQCHDRYASRDDATRAD